MDELRSVRRLSNHTGKYADESAVVSRKREKAKIEIEREKQLFTKKALEEQRLKIFMGMSRRLKSRIQLKSDGLRGPSQKTRQAASRILQNIN